MVIMNKIIVSQTNKYYFGNFNNCFLFLVIGFQKGDIRPFLVEGQQVGLIKSDVIKQLNKYPEVFCIRDCEYTKQVSYLATVCVCDF